MGIDFGAKHVGIALSDPGRIIASPFETIKRERESMLRPTYRRITDIMKEQDVDLVVLGHPLNMDDTKSERTLKCEAFGEELARRIEAEHLEAEVVLWDERLSTVSADEILVESGIEVKDRKKYVDKIAAALILEDFMKNSGRI